MSVNWRCVFAFLDPRRNFRLRLGLAIGSVALILSILLSLLVGYTASKQLEASTGKFLQIYLTKWQISLTEEYLTGFTPSVGYLNYPSYLQQNRNVKFYFVSLEVLLLLQISV